jgi:D-xylose transport system substrate-binding protein
VQLFNGVTPAPKQRLKDPESGAYIPSTLLQSRAINIDNVGDVIKDGFQTYAAVCGGSYAAACSAHHVIG